MVKEPYVSLSGEASTLACYTHAVTGLHAALEKAADPQNWCNVMWENNAVQWARLLHSTAKTLVPSLRDEVEAQAARRLL